MNAVTSVKPPRASAAPELRRHLFIMVAGTVAVHVVAVALYYGLGIEQRSPNVRRIFTALWMVVTLPVVLVGMTRIRAARLRMRQARRVGGTKLP